jgi:hypothetical protein
MSCRDCLQPFNNKAVEGLPAKGIKTMTPNNALHRDAVRPGEFDDFVFFMVWFQLATVSPSRVSFLR